VGGSKINNTQPHKLTKVSTAEFKKAFSTSRPRLVDPVSGGLAFAATASGPLTVPILVPFVVVVTTTVLVWTHLRGLGNTIFIPSIPADLGVDTRDIPYDPEDPIGFPRSITALTENLQIIERWLAYMTALALENRIPLALQEQILSYLETLTNMQESYYDLLNNCVTQLEEDASPLADNLQELLENWRTTGNLIRSTYRLFENKLCIRPENSRIPTQWFED